MKVCVDIIFYDLAGNEIEPKIPVSVTLTAIEKKESRETLVVHVDDDGQAELIPSEEVTVKTEAESEQAFDSDGADSVLKSASSDPGIGTKRKLFTAAPDQSLRTQAVTGEGLLQNGEQNKASESSDSVQFTADQFSVYAIVEIVIEKSILASDGNNYHITVTCGADSGIPEDAELDVKEILDESESYTEYVLKAEETLGMEEGSAGNIRLFDISIVNKYDHSIKYQPAPGTTVDVKIELADAQDDSLSVVHFADENDAGSLVDTDISEQAVLLETSGFSVYAIIGDTNAKYVFHNIDCKLRHRPDGFAEQNGRGAERADTLTL